jgi:hypothetical protein
MLEKGVRPISGLHADHEYIEFDRDNPSLCFEKILQQISSMSFKSSSEQAQSGESNSPAKSQSDSTSISESETRDWKTPNFDWDYFDYWIALHLSIKDQDNATEQLVYSSYVNKLGNDTSQIKLWEADSLLIKQNLLNHSAIENGLPRIQ